MFKMFFPFRQLIFLLLFLNLLTFKLSAQDGSNRLRSTAAFAEKIYLQFDKDVYTTNQNIWFKAILANAANNIPSDLSGVLYVELIAPNEHIVEKKLVKIEKGIGSNFFNLKEGYEEGKYLVRAYTQWNKNFGTDFIFRSYLNIFHSSTPTESNLIDKVNLVEKKKGEFWLQTILRPQVLDSLQGKRLKVYVGLDSKKDTLSLKEQNDDLFFLDYPISGETALATVTMETSNGRRYTKTIDLGENLLDVQFFPESGELLGGIMNRIGYKAVNYAGKGVQVEGEILDNKNNVVAIFKSNSFGMGDFSLFAASHSYYAKITAPLQEKDTTRYALPKVISKGDALGVLQGKNLVKVVVSSNYRTTDSVFVEVSSRGLAYYMLKGKLNNGLFNTEISSAILPQGIIALTLLDQDKRAVAERIFFNEKPDDYLDIELTTNKSVFKRRDKVELDVQIGNREGNPVKANLSVLVINRDQLGERQNNNRNILSYLLLGSELKGKIENPGHYFNIQNKNRFRDIDVLMLTQGWRKYKYTKPPDDTLIFSPEKFLQVSGTVGGTFSTKKRKEDVELTLMTFGKKQSFYSQNTDSLGRFNFLLEDEFGGNLNILLQSKTKSGRNKNYTVTLEKKEEPKILFDHQQSIVRPDTTVYKIVEKERERKIYEDSFEALSGVTLLDEVFLEGPKMTPQRQKVTDEYGKPETVISGKAIREEEKKWSYGLYSVLLFSFPEKIKMERDDEGVLRARVMNREASLVVIDGIPVMNYEYDLIPHIPPGEVKSVEIIEYANNFYNLFKEVYPEVSPLSVPVTGNVIAIYTNAGKGIYGVEKPKGILQTTIPIFAASKEFYEPKYDDVSILSSEKPDLRSVIKWEPELFTDASGNASLSFYNSDIAGNMLVIVEAIAEDGKIGYQTLNYRVEQK